MSCVRKGLRVGVDNLALDLVGPASIVSQGSRRRTNIALGDGKGLSIVKRLDSSQSVDILLHQVGEFGQQFTSVLRGLLLPWALECLAGGRNGNIDILLGGLVDGTDNFFVCGIDGLEGLALDALYKLIVDEPRSCAPGQFSGLKERNGSGDTDAG